MLRRRLVDRFETIALWLAAAWLASGCEEQPDTGGIAPHAGPSAPVSAPSTAAPSASSTTAGGGVAGAGTTPEGQGTGVSSLPLPDAGSHVSISGSSALGAGLPCAVAAVVSKHCATCHVAQGSAPMALTSAADFGRERSGSPTRVLAKQRLNTSDPQKAMPPGGYPDLTTAELEVMNRWLDQGAPTSNERCTTAAESDAGAPPNTAADGEPTCYPMLAHNGDGKTPYRVGVAADAYMGFTFAAPWKQTEYAILFRPVIDNVKVVHHWLLFQDNAPGTPGPAVQQSGVHADKEMIAIWAPGSDALDFRKSGADVGLELPADTTYMLELHYNSSDAAAIDRSGVEVCTARRKPTHSAGYSWVGSQNLLFPSAKWTSVCQPTSEEPIHILAIIPHMHLTGVHMKATLNRVDGRKEIFHDLDFDFNYERLYPLDLTMQPGDTITTECTYSEPKTYGPGVHDEMCYLFTAHYPRGALTSPDLVGGVVHGGHSCLGQ